MLNGAGIGSEDSFITIENLKIGTTEEYISFNNEGGALTLYGASKINSVNGKFSITADGVMTVSTITGSSLLLGNSFMNERGGGGFQTSYITLNGLTSSDYVSASKVYL